MNEQDFNYEREYPIEFRDDCKILLRKCLIAFSEIPNTVINYKGIKDTYELASQISKLIDK